MVRIFTPVRLTKANRQKLLDCNDGFSIQTSYESKNHKWDRIYTIVKGSLHVTETGKTSWADSHYEKSWIASDEEVHRFLYKYQEIMKPIK